jgi:phosphate/sulfate permease
MTLTLAILFGLFLAYANGANDNFKGVATSMAAARRVTSERCSGPR